MRRTRPLTGAALAALTVAAAVTGIPASAADTGGDLYVTNSSACSDKGPGTQAVPFCDPQAAADVVQPGQTVLIGGRFTGENLYGPMSLARSGTPSQPITFEADPSLAGDGQSAALGGNAQHNAPLTLNGVHDVTVRGLHLTRDTDTDAVDVNGSQNVTLNQLTTGSLGPNGGDDVRIDGTSSGVTVSRSTLDGMVTHAVEALAGAHDVTVTTNVMSSGYGAAVALDGTANAAVTSNTLSGVCFYEVALDGATTGTVENNAFSSQKQSSNNSCPGDSVVTADATAAPGVTADYNDFESARVAGEPAYSWAGTAYATPAARTAATGAGAHDHAAAVLFRASFDDSLGVDAADADAPGELPTDIAGFRRTDDPSVANTGAGGHGYDDRGAYETHDTLTVPAGESATPSRGTVPLATTVPVGDATSAWGEPLTYTVDFGDGSAPVTGTATDVPAHTYTTPGAYTETVTATDSDGVTQTRSTTVVAASDDPAPAAVTAQHDVAPYGVSGGRMELTLPTAGDYEMASQSVSWGDGTTDSVLDAEPVAFHQYAEPGPHTATLTRTDVLGRVTTGTASFTASDSAFPYKDFGQVTATIAAHGTWTIPGAPYGVFNADPVSLRVNATAAADGGWLTAYPAGGTRPSASTLNFPARHDASNQETVVPSPSGDVAIYNGAASSVKVSVAFVGAFSPQGYGDSYHPTSPTTLLDTRNGTGGVSAPVGGGKSLTLQIAGKNGVPSDATAVTLDVAENTTKSSGSLTVTPDGTPVAAVTASYWAAGESVTNLVTVPLTDGKVELTNTGTGTANLYAALAGWSGSDATGSGVRPVTPTRVLNTQTGLGEPGGKALRLAAHAMLKVKIAGTAGLPATGLTAADLNLTVSAPAASGWLVAYPDGTTPATAGALNYTKGHTIAGQAVIKVGADGDIDLVNPTATPIDVFADIHGGYVPMS